MGHILQRLHPRIRPGLNLSAAGSKVPVHSQQSRWDCSCTMHCVAMVLHIAGLITDPSRIATRRRRLEAALWRRTVPHFFEGLTFDQLAVLIAELDCGLRPTVARRSAHRDVIPFIERELARQRLVICSLRAIGNMHSHAVLAIGIEGIQRMRHLDAHTLLILDPAEAPPGAMATCNARIHYGGRDPAERPRYARYTTVDATYSIVLNGAVSIDLAGVAKPP